MSNVPEPTAGLRFRVGPVPVTIHVSSPLILGLLGLELAGDLGLLALWVAIGILSIVIHELGHAAVVHLAGGRARIDLQWLGGLTRYQPTERLQRRMWSIAVSLAGPGTGIVIGLGLRWLDELVTITDRYVAAALEFGWFVSFVWALFNLLPVLPLDGGQAARELLPGTPAQRTRRAAALGTGVGGAVAVWAVVVGQVYVALLIGLMTWRNLQLARSAVATRRSGPTSEDHPPELAGHVEREELRQRARVGEASEQEILSTVRDAARDEEHLVVVEFVNMALGHGARDPRLPWQAARSWTALDQRDRANTMVRAALELGADERELSADPELRPLHDHPRWPLGTTDDG